MRILSVISGALLGMVFMVSANQVQARESGDWYTSFSVGVVIPQDADVETNGAVTETNEYDVGYDISGAVGVYVGSNFRLEFAVGGREYEVSGGDFVDPVLDDMGDPVTLFPEGSTLTAVSFMANGYWDILGVSNPFEPYIGFGVGVANWSVDDANVDDANVEGSTPGFMLNTMVGANYHFTDNLAVGASYRFAYSNPEDDEVADLGKLAFEQFNHSILGTVTVVF